MRNYMTAYLCGNDGDCTMPPTEASFKLAMHNLLHNFDLMGIVEDMGRTGSLLVKMFPQLFKSNNIAARKGNSNPHTDPGDDMKLLVRKLNHYDHILYEVAKEMLHRRAKACGFDFD